MAARANCRLCGSSRHSCCATFNAGAAAAAAANAYKTGRRQSRRADGGRSGSQPLPIDLRALPKSCALTFKSGHSSCPSSDQPMALSARARAVCAVGAAAKALGLKAPTDGAECARVLSVQFWCGEGARFEGADAARRAAQPEPNVVPRRCGLATVAAAATEATNARHRRNATVSSALLLSPWGRAPSGAWVHAG